MKVVKKHVGIKSLLKRLALGGTLFQETNTQVLCHKRIQKILYTRVYNKSDMKKIIKILVNTKIEINQSNLNKFYICDNAEQHIYLRVGAFYLTRAGKRCRIKSFNGTSSAFPCIIEIEGESRTESLTFQGRCTNSGYDNDNDIVDYWYI